MLHYGKEISERGIRGEQALWRAVITQALMDASNHSSKMELKYEKSQSLCWLSSGNKDFRTVCEYAGLDPNYVRQQALAALERDCQWREPSISPNKDISNKIPPSRSIPKKELLPCH